MDWQTRVKLLSPILSKPMKLDWAAVSNDPANIVIETMDTKDTDSGLWKTVEPMKLARNRQRNERIRPVATSKISPATMMLRVSASLSEALQLAMYFVIAEFTPQSRKRFISNDGIRATPYSPYSAGDISLVRTTVPTAIIIVDTATPMSSWKLPEAEVLPISSAFSM